jgi:histidyl-tRNA synthetase
MSDKIKPTLMTGFQDFLPKEMIIRQQVFRKIERVCELFGFDPLETSTIERKEVLTGNNPDFDMLLYRASLSRGSATGSLSVCQSCTAEFSSNLDVCPECGALPKDVTELALRFDLTVPLARVVAGNQELAKPFKRYQTGKVFRGERPQAGRYREFSQFDMDTVGTKSMMADTEIVNMMYEIMRAIGFERFLVRINNRKVFNGLAIFGGFENSFNDVLKVIDKIDKIGVDEVKAILSETLAADQVERIMKFVSIKGSSSEVIDQLLDLFKDTPLGLEGANELKEIADNLTMLGVPEENWAIDLSIVRGLGYYTGPVFETTLLDLPKFGSVFSGGRYDGLVGRFSDNDIPATGASVGVDRIFAAMKKLGMVQQVETVTEVLILFFDPSLKKDYLELAANLRNAGIKTELYLEQGTAFKKQLNFAVRQQIPIVLIMGPEEAQANQVQIKDMVAGTRVNVSITDCVSTIQSILKP